MLKFLRDKKKDNKGFTLVELVIVVAILAILVGILAPQYTKYVEKSRKAADASNLENLVTILKTAAADSTDSVPAATYTFEITANGTTLKQGSTPLAASSDTNNPNVYDLVTSFAGNDWSKTTLKSKKWENGDTTDGAAKNTIKAAVEVGSDGTVSVTYYPSTVKDLAK